MLGISYINKEISEKLKRNIINYCSEERYNNSFWEVALMCNSKMIVKANIAKEDDIIEIDTYEQLRELDKNSSQLYDKSIELIKEAFKIKDSEIKNITVLKKGMTNKSFLFEYNDSKYIMRIPGEGTDSLINRKQEANVYNVINNTGISDDIYYINPNNGYKITKYIENARVCDPYNWNDVMKCMKILRDFHNLKLKINHEFDMFKQINFYESLWNGDKSIYIDYEVTKKNVISLKKYVEKFPKEKTLTHIDAVPDNFLFYKEESTEKIKLIDWEYSGMQDPHVDIAMFAIYSLYDRDKVDKLIDIYFEGNCTVENRIKIYCYISICGLLWSNWCEFKRNLGIEFGEYSLKQYRYAKEYYKIVKEEIKKLKGWN